MDSLQRVIGKSAETARCIFCGTVGLWWTCSCESADKVREGKVPRPRTVIRNGIPIIEMCEELRRAARLAGVITREYKKDGIADSRENTLGDSRKVAETVELSESDDLATCPSCGKRFRARSMRQRYCSDVCRSRAQRG
jgi:hypothetical protein